MKPTFKIIQINLESNTSIIIQYISPYANGGWIRINPDAFIRISGTEEKYTLKETEGIAISPEKTEIYEEGQVVYFTLYFPLLPDGTEYIDLVEDESDPYAFNMYSVPINSQKSSVKKSNILDKIEDVALAINQKKAQMKSFFKESEPLKPKLLEIAKFLGLEFDETAVFCSIAYASIINERFMISEFKRMVNIDPFEIYEIKGIINNLEKKGWLKKIGKSRSQYEYSRLKEKLYKLSPTVEKALFKDEKPVIIKPIIDITLTVDILNKCLLSYIEEEIDREELVCSLKDFEDEYQKVEPFSVKINSKLGINEGIIFYYLVTKTSIDEPIVEIDRMVNLLFKEGYEKKMLLNLLTREKSELFDLNIIEMVNDEFIDNKRIKLTQEIILKVFGEDNLLVNKQQKFNTDGLCRLIEHKKITEKQLFYNSREQEEITTISEFLNPAKYNDIIKRLEENKMPQNLTILLHGYPGTGKTESVYQLAKQNERNILMVNVSEIRDKWVGESEKNLKEIFNKYKLYVKKNGQIPILLFNEADALISKRININSSVDQMNNTMQNILLQEIEDFKGILIATTNLTHNLDSAFERRFLYKIEFSKPNEYLKQCIWLNKIPQLNENQAIELANQFDLSGAQIDNISRKSFLNHILNGTQICFETILKYCEEEIFGNNRKIRIGF